MAFPTGWGFYCAVTIPHSLVTATQTYIPWILQAAAMPTGANGLWLNCNSDGSDIRFTSDSAGSVPLHFEIMNWNVSTPTATFYIKIPSLSASVDTVIYIWYKNTGATAPAANDATWGSQGVWDANYVGVYHCEEAASTNILDSTSYGNNLAQSGYPGTTVGKVDKARTFSNNTYAHVASPDLTVETVEAWIAGLDALYTMPFGNTSSSAAYDQGRMYSEVTVLIWYISNPLGDTSYTSGTITTTGVHYLGISDDGTCSATGVKLIYDGNPVTMTGGGSGSKPAVGNCGAMTVGRPGDYNGYYLNGWLDEIRISNFVRSPDWIKTSYNNQANISTSGTPGTPTASGGGVVDANFNQTGISITCANGSSTFSGSGLFSNTGLTVSSAIGTNIANGGATVNQIGITVLNTLGTNGYSGTAFISPSGKVIVVSVGTNTAQGNATFDANINTIGLIVQSVLGNNLFSGSAVIGTSGIDCTSGLGSNTPHGGAGVNQVGIVSNVTLGSVSLSGSAVFVQVGQQVLVLLGLNVTDISPGIPCIGIVLDIGDEALIEGLWDIVLDAGDSILTSEESD